MKTLSTSLKTIATIVLFLLHTNLFSQVGIKECASGYHHTLMIGMNDSLWVFGENYDGQLGDGTNYDILAPKNTGVRAIGMACGYNYSFYIKTDSTIMASGMNTYGELGTGNTTDKNTWTQIALSSTVHFKQLAASSDHTVAVTGNGYVYAWGNNKAGELGDGTTTPRTSPVQVKDNVSGNSLTNIKKVACGSPDNDANTGGHSLALMNDGTVWTWGLNASGQLGDGSGGDRKKAVQVLGINGVGFLTNVIDIAASGNSSFALLADSTVVSWGDNTQGQLGDGTTNSRQFPQRVKTSLLTNITSVKQISASGAGLSYDFLAMLRSDGKVWNVGDNSRGQLGVGTVINIPYAVRNNPTSTRSFKQVVATGHFQIDLSNDTLGNYCQSGHQVNGSFGNGSSSNALISNAACVTQNISSLPVTMSSFTGKRTEDKVVVLRWTTASEINNDRFELEYSYDGREYDVIGIIKGGGNRTDFQDYQFIHKNANKTRTGYYRIKQIDFNGNFEYHTTILVKPGKVQANIYANPNPTKGSFSITLGEETNTPYTITVIDQAGKKVMDREGYIYNSPVSEKFDLNDLAKGLYFVTIKTDFSTIIEKVMKQ